MEGHAYIRNQRGVYHRHKSYHEKFLKFAQIMPYLAAIPYIWCALELKRYFDIEEPLGPDNAEDIYRRTNQRIRQLHMTPGWCLERSGVEAAQHHGGSGGQPGISHEIKENAALKTRILTAFRPDRAFYCERKTFPDYMKILSQAAGAGKSWIHFHLHDGSAGTTSGIFAEFGTTVSDNGIAHIAWEEYTEAQAEDIFQKAAGWGSSYQRWK